MLMPKRVKRRKQQRGRMTGRATRGNVIAYGEFALVATEPGWIKSRQIEAARVAMTRYIKRGGQVWIDIFPHKPITQKPAETRMGSGKGNVEYWVAVVKPDRVLFEMAGIPEDQAREGFETCFHKNFPSNASLSRRNPLRPRPPSPRILWKVVSANESQRIFRNER
jgi:large subunit ribosomal protein L16